MSRKNVTGTSPMTKVGAESREDYLEAIYVLSGMCDSMIKSSELAEYMNFSRPSVCNAIGRLKHEGLLLMDENFFISLTEKGIEETKRIYEKHRFFESLLLNAGVDPDIAEQEACHMEHAISQDSFIKLRTHLEHK